MIDSLWKLNVADIEATLSRVCQMVLQDNNAKKEELHARAKGLKTLGKFFQRVKSANGNDTEMILNGGVHKLNGSESSKLNGSESRKMNGSESSNDATSSTSLRYERYLSFSLSPYVETPNIGGFNFPKPTPPIGAPRHSSMGRE
ncbi:hypothetical protein I3842_07G131900 [Carya illinoinensis]|uniref:DNAJ-containing protein X-domain domain-containing protein n=1 Tax=Carya illinoinensis TaxID=32201 RepID=A0A922JHG0_CARIL|nr:hypothetical protein I3842_07G131900 [Carya illinoinensis]